MKAHMLNIRSSLTVEVLHDSIFPMALRKYGDATYEELQREANRLRVENEILKNALIVAESAYNDLVVTHDSCGE